MDCRLPNSSIHGIFQARLLEWVAISFSREFSRPRDRTQVSSIAGRRFTIWTTREVSSKQETTTTKIQTQSLADRITTSLSLAHQGKNKQMKKLSTNFTQKKFTQTIEPTLGGQKPKGRKNSTFFKKRIKLSLKPGKRRPQNTIS